MNKSLIYKTTLVTFITIALVVFSLVMRNDTTIIEHRITRSFADTSFTLLCITLAIGPLSKLRTYFTKFIQFRRQFGISTFVTAAFHGISASYLFANFNLLTMLGVEYSSQANTFIRIMPSGFGIANLMAIVAFIVLLVLCLTSTDFAINKLGSASWKWLHRMVYVAFYLTFLHAFYYIFMHYMPSSVKQAQADIEANWFGTLFLISGFGVILLQIFAFIKTVKLMQMNKPTINQ